MGEYDQHLLRKQGKFNKERVSKPLFRLGQIVGTQGALQALLEAQQPDEFFQKKNSIFQPIDTESIGYGYEAIVEYSITY